MIDTFPNIDIMEIKEYNNFEKDLSNEILDIIELDNKKNGNL
jgi:hypothetical protein